MSFIDWILLAVILTAFVFSIIATIKNKGCSCSDCSKCKKASCGRRK